VPEDKIDIVYLGVNLDTYRVISDTEALEKLREKYSLPDRFILFVGAMLANKNLERIIRSFHSIKAEQEHKDVGLVIAGGRGWNSGPIYDLVRELKLEKEVTFTGFISQEDKVGLYNLATLYAFPSLVEGFGLPVLEAFACGTPVVTSNTTAMPEVAGDSAILVDPLDQDEITGAFHRILSDNALSASLVGKGLSRANEFTWQKTALETIKVYEKALAG